MTAPPVRRWLVETASRIDAAMGPARMSRIALPSPAAESGKDGEFCAVQLECGNVGLAFTLLGDTLPRLRARKPDTGELVGNLIRGYAEGDEVARTLGLAAINALTRRLFQRAGYTPDDSLDSFGSLALKAGDRLGMIGHFTPLIPRARALGIPVTVLELREDLVREEPGLSVTLDAGRLAECNKIISTSTLLLNDTFEATSALWRDAEAVAIVGPSAGCPPDALFAAGVSTVGTAWVTDTEAFLARIESGARWGDTSRKVTFIRQQYPGLDALLDRACAN